MTFLFSELPLPMVALLFFGVGVCVGQVASKIIRRLTVEDESVSLSESVSRETIWPKSLPILSSLRFSRHKTSEGQSVEPWRLWVELSTGLLYAAFVVAFVGFDCQQTPEVAPSDVWRYGRIIYHLILITLLVIATGTDFHSYIIPDCVAFIGLVIGLAGATISGELQMVHIWVDWNQVIPGLRGPYFPDWLHPHAHWHGFAWSASGAIAGAGIIWLVRAISSFLLGQPTLGLGDVTLMAMIGSFIGWQPVIFVFLLGPLCGLVVGLSVRLLTGKTFLPLGPYLSVATVIVLFSWKWLWLLTRNTFGDWPSLAKLGGAALIAMIVLLGLIRFYRAIPGKSR